MKLADTIPQDVSEAALGRVINHGASFSTAALVGAAFLFAQGVLAARTLGAADFGVLAIVVGAVTVVRQVLSLRPGELVVRFVSDALVDHEFRAAGATVKVAAVLEVISAAAATGAAIVLAPWIAQWFTDSPAHASRVALYALVIPFGMLSETSHGVLQAFGRFDFQVLVQSLERVVALAATGAALAAGGTLDAFVIAAAAGPAVGGVLAAALAVGEAHRRIGERWHRAPLGSLAGRRRKMLGYAVRSSVSGWLSLVTKADVLWLGWFRTPIEVGYYALAWSLANLAMIPVAPIAQGVFPDLAHFAAARQGRDLRLVVRRTSEIVGAFVIVALLVAAVTGGELVREIFGMQYRPAAEALTALLFGVGVTAILFWARPVLQGLSVVPVTVFTAAVAAALKVALVLRFVPEGGFVAIAWITSAVLAVGTGLMFVRARFALGRHGRM